VIRLEGVNKIYCTGKLEVRALRGVDLVVEPGEFVAVMGPSGSGKTTLLEILGCLSRPSAGRYWLSGSPVGELDSEALARIRGSSATRGARSVPSQKFAAHRGRGFGPRARRATEP
jgi:putative ABC transport system ATP-binding protein